MTHSLWRAIAKRLSKTLNDYQVVSSRYRNLFQPRDNFPLDGIVAELTRICGGNVHERGVVDVSASAVWSNYSPQNAVDLGQKICFHSPNQPNQWLCYDFKNSFLCSWVVEGSDDGSRWTVLDERTNNTEADSRNPIITFPVTRHRKCRFIRLRQTGKNANHSHFLALFGFELFGRVNGSDL
jgi:hypothetical protein